MEWNKDYLFKANEVISFTELYDKMVEAGADKGNVFIYVENERLRFEDVKAEYERELLTEAMSVWGREAQYGMFHEETGELMQALNKYRRNETPETTDHLCEEIADVEIVLAELKTMLPEDRLQWWHDFKMGRLRKRLEHTKAQRKQNYETALQMAGRRYDLFKVLADNGAICTDGQMDEIVEAVLRDLKVNDPEEVKG